METANSNHVIRKAISVIPYLVMFFLTPFYNILDSIVLVKVFGCGCVPDVQSNMFNIAFNANDLRMTVYGILTVLMVLLSVRFSKVFENKWIKVIYVLTVLMFNLILGFWICRAFTWG
ncbi:MAG: hypothetical protein IJZ25_00560 [Lachnospiraceae bacterium]|nr:hypothetical protein [Lachnospiraceae bacterium]